MRHKRLPFSIKNDQQVHSTRTEADARKASRFFGSQCGACEPLCLLRRTRELRQRTFRLLERNRDRLLVDGQRLARAGVADADARTDTAEIQDRPVQRCAKGVLL